MYLFYILSSALTEAQDINLYLNPLRCCYEDLEQQEFDEVDKFLPPLMHTVCLVWANSKFYNTPSRIIVLLQESCNLLIDMVRYLYHQCMYI